MSKRKRKGTRVTPKKDEPKPPTMDQTVPWAMKRLNRAGKRQFRRRVY